MLTVAGCQLMLTTENKSREYILRNICFHKIQHIYKGVPYGVLTLIHSNSDHCMVSLPWKKDPSSMIYIQGQLNLFAVTLTFSSTRLVDKMVFNTYFCSLAIKCLHLLSLSICCKFSFLNWDNDFQGYIITS